VKGFFCFQVEQKLAFAERENKKSQFFAKQKRLFICNASIPRSALANLVNKLAFAERENKKSQFLAQQKRPTNLA
jgi:hypothetical protein